MQAEIHAGKRIHTDNTLFHAKVGIKLPILLSTMGTGWLMTARSVVPGVQWTWVLLLAVLGALLVFTRVRDAASLVAGPSLIATSLLSVLRQTGRIGLDVELAVLMILVGVLWAAARVVSTPKPEMCGERPGARNSTHEGAAA